MNRQILFRGKNQSGNWIDGDVSNLVVGNDIKLFISWVEDHEIHLPPNGINDYYPTRIEYALAGEEIDPNTLGQYTGFTDQNGENIFEGDILYNEYVVQMEDGRWLARTGISVIEAEYFCNFDITGTIHD